MERWTRLVLRFRWPILVGWLVVLLAGGFAFTRLSSLPGRNRLKVRSRLHHGAHLPHPGIRERRTSALQVTLPKALPIELDGEVVGTGRTLSLRVEPDALTVVV